MNNFTGSLVAIIGLFTGVAIVATLVSKNANTQNIVTSTFQGIGTAIQAATGPVTGSSMGVGSLSSLSI